ncbi:MAG: serine/threonine protein kinase, partial [Zoogloea sp.]
HRFLHELADAEVPAVAPLEFGGRSLLQHEGFRFALFPRRGGRAPELEQPEVLGRIGTFMGRIHAIGARKPFTHRPDLTIHTFGEAPRDALMLSPFLPDELRTPWLSVVDMALEGVRRCYERAGEQPLLRLHGDCHGGNVLWTDAGPHFVDFDDARNGPAVQDLWMLLSGDAQSMARQLDLVLEGYEQFADFDPASLHLVEALRTLRLIHYAGWIASRWEDPAFPAAFGWFNTQRYWQDMILALREQIALMDESALARLF